MSEENNCLHNECQDKAIYRQAFDCAMDYLDGQRKRPVFPTSKSLLALNKLDEPHCRWDRPQPPDVLRLLHEIGSPATVAQGGGRYFGFVNGGVIPAALAARLLTDVWDQKRGAASHVAHRRQTGSGL